MGRWTQLDEDRYRLPEGFKRVAYDADSKRYTFVDANGIKYVGNPGEEYGYMTPVASLPQQPRPGAFSDERTHGSTPSVSSAEAASSFHDILPSNRIGGAPPPTDEKKASQKQRNQNLADVVETVMPKVQGVVQNLRRSMTSARRSSPKHFGDIKGADRKSLGDAPPPYGDEKYAYSDHAWEAQKAQWAKADSKSMFRSRSSASVNRARSNASRQSQQEDGKQRDGQAQRASLNAASAPSLQLAQANTSPLTRTLSKSSTISSLDYASDDSDSYIERTRDIDRAHSTRSGMSDVSRATRMSVSDPRRSPVGLR
ncbi:hypothetical protein HDZ31DRAFT_79833 [Schizophyllum fasciatum]